MSTNIIKEPTEDYTLISKRLTQSNILTDTEYRLYCYYTATEYDKTNSIGKILKDLHWSNIKFNKANNGLIDKNILNKENKIKWFISNTTPIQIQ